MVDLRNFDRDCRFPPPNEQSSPVVASGEIVVMAACEVVWELLTGWIAGQPGIRTSHRSRRADQPQRDRRSAGETIR